MKRIAIVADIAIVGDDERPLVGPDGKPATASFSEFIKYRTRDKNYAGADGFTVDDLESALKIRRLLSEAIAAAESSFVVDMADYERLHRSVRKPASGWEPSVAEQLLPFMRAVLDAKEV